MDMLRSVRLRTSVASAGLVLMLSATAPPPHPAEKPVPKSAPAPVSPVEASNHDGGQVSPAAHQPPVNIAAPAPVRARLPGFASELAQHPEITGPTGWPSLSHAEAWDALALAQPSARQAARWAYIKSLIGQSEGWSGNITGFGSETLGVTEVMLADDPDLLLVPNFRLARGIALTRTNRATQALPLLLDPGLTSNPEACLWRMVAYQQINQPAAALGEIACAVSAINRRALINARPYILIAARAALARRQPGRAFGWLKQLPDNDSAAELLRGQALLAQGKETEARTRLNFARDNGRPGERADAQMSLLEATGPRLRMRTRDALKALDHLSFTWRGDEIEQRALRLGYRMAQQLHDGSAILGYGGLLIRYFGSDPQSADILARCQQQLMTTLDPASRIPLDQAAGLFWNYRDLAPAGTQGDAMLMLLARRLTDARLYERAADLLAYQMLARAQDIEKGPVSVQVARLYLLAGAPDRAIIALRNSDEPVYPETMLNDRHRMEAVALYQLGKVDQAMAILDDMPDMAALRGEMLWRRHDWQGMVSRLGSLPQSQALGSVDQAIVLRQAVALNMVGNETELAKLRTRYAAAFARSSSQAAFALLTGPVEAMSSESIARAMVAIPSVSVAGPFEPLLNAKPMPPLMAATKARTEIAHK